MTGEFKLSPPVGAPLWRGATEAELLGIINALSQASFHYADDSGKEWGAANYQKRRAAAECNRLNFDFDALKAIHAAKPQLVTLGDFVSAVLTLARQR